MKAALKMKIRFKDKTEGEAAYHALSHELREENRTRTKASVEQETLIIEIEADDVVALRA